MRIDDAQVAFENEPQTQADAATEAALEPMNAEHDIREDEVPGEDARDTLRRANVDPLPDPPEPEPFVAEPTTDSGSGSMLSRRNSDHSQGPNFGSKPPQTDAVPLARPASGANDQPKAPPPAPPPEPTPPPPPEPYVPGIPLELNIKKKPRTPVTSDLRVKDSLDSISEQRRVQKRTNETLAKKRMVEITRNRNMAKDLADTTPQVDLGAVPASETSVDPAPVSQPQPVTESSVNVEGGLKKKKKKKRGKTRTKDRARALDDVLPTPTETVYDVQRRLKRTTSTDFPRGSEDIVPLNNRDRNF